MVLFENIQAKLSSPSSYQGGSTKLGEMLRGVVRNAERKRRARNPSDIDPRLHKNDKLRTTYLLTHPFHHPLYIQIHENITTSKQGWHTHSSAIS